MITKAEGNGQYLLEAVNVAQQAQQAQIHQQDNTCGLLTSHYVQISVINQLEIMSTPSDEDIRIDSGVSNEVLLGFAKKMQDETQLI